MKAKTLQDVFHLWEASDNEGGKLKLGNAGPTGKGVVNYNRPLTVLRKQDRVNSLISGQNTQGKKAKFIPGNDKKQNKNNQQIQQLKDRLLKLKAELTSLENIEEGLITPDFGTSVLGRSLFTGAVLPPPNGYGPNFEPAPPAPEELPPGYQKNTLPDPIVPEEEDFGFQHQDVAGTILAPKQWIPRESVARTALGTSFRTAKQRRKLI